jgi:uncharacterized membrane protein
MVQRWNIDRRTCAGGLWCLLLGAALTGCGSAGSGTPGTPEVSSTPDVSAAPDVSGTPGKPDTQEISAPEPVASQTCEGALEFVPLGALPDTQDSFGPLPRTGPDRLALDPSSQRVLWTIENSPGLENSAFRWSKEHGLSELARDARDSNWDPPEEVPYLRVTLLSADGRVGAGASNGDTGFVWSDTGEVSRLGLVPQAINRDGTVIIGWKGTQRARWTLAGGLELLGVPAASPLLSAAGDVIVSNEEAGNCLRWTEASGDEPLGLLPGATQCHVLMMNETGDVVVGVQQVTRSGRARVFRWTRELGLQEPDLGKNTSAWPQAMSGDGGVIVAEVGDAAGINPRSTRWMVSSGAVQVEEDTNLHAGYVSPSGDAVMGGISDSVVKSIGEVDALEAFRWTEADGLKRLGIHRGGVAVGGKLLVGYDFDHHPQILRFGDLGSGSRLVDRLPPGIVPEGWSDVELDSFSEDGGLLIGSALNPDGERQLWLQHLRCP